MLSRDLRSILDELGLTQVDFARLIGVTPRAVSLWMVGDRGIPGPAEAYARLIYSIPPSARQVELARLKQKGTTAMRDGMYGIEYHSNGGAGLGILVVDRGRVFGTDPLGGKYDGDYVYDDATGLADLHLKVTLPPNTMSIFGISNPYEWAFDVTTKINPRLDSGEVRLTTTLGPAVNARYRYLRALPDS
jgi:hypothetical protein